MTINALIAQYELQTSWFLNALEDISSEESNSSSYENLNTLQWVAGHLTDSRFTILAMVSGTETDSVYKQWFGKGTTHRTGEGCPGIEQIKADWIKVSENLKASLRWVSEEKLLSKPPFQTSIPDETLLGLIAFFATHESFHIGQLSVLRKLMGKPAMSLGRRH